MSLTIIILIIYLYIGLSFGIARAIWFNRNDYDMLPDALITGMLWFLYICIMIAYEIIDRLGK